MRDTPELSRADEDAEIIKGGACAEVVVVEVEDADVEDRVDRRGHVVGEVEAEEHKQDVAKGGAPNVEAEGGLNATGRGCSDLRSSKRRGGKRKDFFLQGGNVIDVITAHRRAECPNRKDDWVACFERKAFEDVARAKRGEHVGDGEGDVACACDLGAEAIWDGFGEEGVEADAERGEGDGHEEGENNERPDLRLRVEEPGEGNP